MGGRDGSAEGDNSRDGSPRLSPARLSCQLSSYPRGNGTSGMTIVLYSTWNNGTRYSWQKVLAYVITSQVGRSRCDIDSRARLSVARV